MNRVVVVSNRVPNPSQGEQAGGLAVALGGLMQKRGGLWFGWSGQVAEDAHERPPVIETHANVTYATLDLTPGEHDRYYGGFSNGLLWPLLHTMPELMSYDRRDAQSYREVNARIADALLPLLRPNDLIWVHDYHLLSLPAALRARGVRSPIGFFLHIPFPAEDVLSALPDGGGLVRDVLAADLAGFQTDRDAANFVGAAVSLAGATSLPGGWLAAGAHRVQVAAFPVEIATKEFAAMAESAAGGADVARLLHTIEGQTLLLGADRLDPTKGLLQRVAAYRKLLENHEECRRTTTLLQFAPVSRKDVASYRDLRVALDREAGSLNADFAEPDWTPLRLIAQKGAPRDAVAGYMRIARVGLVTPIRDGMNLVAKEFIAAQDPDDPGVLILSRFAGAARQLEASLLVNPHDPDDMAEALFRALRMPRGERVRRWRACWAQIEHATPTQWGRAFLAALLRAALAQSEVPRRIVREPVWAETIEPVPHPRLIHDPVPRTVN